MSLESSFQSKLKKQLKEMFPGCMVFKMDTRDNPGVPDLLILYKDKWATLECKRESTASKQPRQPYYVDKMNEMSFSAFIFPENQKEVLNDLRRAFGA